MTLSSVVLISSLHQTARIITSENLIQIDDLRNTQLEVTQNDHWKQYNLSRFILNWVEECTQAPSEVAYRRTIVSVLGRAKAKKIEGFR